MNNTVIWYSQLCPPFVTSTWWKFPCRCRKRWTELSEPSGPSRSRGVVQLTNLVFTINAKFSNCAYILFISLSPKSVADSGFPEGERSTQRGCQSIIWPHFYEKLQENGKKLGLEGEYVSEICLCRSATMLETSSLKFNYKSLLRWLKIQFLKQYLPYLSIL